MPVVKSPTIRPARWWRRQLVPLWVLALMFAFMAATLGYRTFVLDPEQHARADATTTALKQEQAHAISNGIQTVAPPADSIADGKATAPPTDKVPTSPTTVINQTIAASAPMVRQAVAEWFAAHPVKTPSVDLAALKEKLVPDVARFVSSYLAAHPPAPGAPGSPGVNGHNGHNGADGHDGEPGHTPTAEEIAAVVTTYLPAAVADYLTANPPAAGPTGPSGPGPTSDQIRDVVADWIATNGVPCGDGQTKGNVTVQDVSGKTVTIRACVVAVQPADPSGPTTQPS